MAVTSRQGLIDYALRKLGSPVIEIEVDEEQLEDRLDEALQFYQDFHYDGTERIYMQHRITGSTVAVGNTSGFILGEVVKAQTSGIEFRIEQITSSTQVLTKVTSKDGMPSDSLVIGEVLIGQTSNHTTNFISKVKGDIENRYVPCSPLVTGVIRVVPFTSAVGTDNYMFDPKYQLIVSQFNNLAYTNMVYYEQIMQYISLLDSTLKPEQSVRFNQKMDRIYIDMKWTDAAIGDYVVFEVFRILDPAVFTKIYNDRMLKKLVTAKIKYQWGSNLQKYDSIQLLGGVTVNADTIMNQAINEIEAAETEIRDSFEEKPIGFFG